MLRMQLEREKRRHTGDTRAINGMYAHPPIAVWPLSTAAPAAAAAAVAVAPAAAYGFSEVLPMSDERGNAWSLPKLGDG